MYSVKCILILRFEYEVWGELLTVLQFYILPFFRLLINKKKY